MSSPILRIEAPGGASPSRISRRISRRIHTLANSTAVRAHCPYCSYNRVGLGLGVAALAAAVLCACLAVPGQSPPGPAPLPAPATKDLQEAQEVVWLGAPARLWQTKDVAKEGMEEQTDVLFLPDFPFEGPIVNISDIPGRKIEEHGRVSKGLDIWDAVMRFLIDGATESGGADNAWNSAMMSKLLPDIAPERDPTRFAAHFSTFIPPGSLHVQSLVKGRGQRAFHATFQPGRADRGACRAGGSLQSTTFLRPDGFLATVVLSCVDRALDFKLLHGSRAARASIPPQEIQLYLFERGGDSPFREGAKPFVGVNMGGWLLVENWMWASQMLHRGLRDEHELVKAHGGPQDPRAISFMRRHWDSFVTEEQLDQLQAFGVTHVRVPVGWWLVDYDPADGFVDGGEFYLARLLGWLQQRGMRCLLDLHAVPGAQVANQSFTGKFSNRAYFFVEREQHERGKRAIIKLAELILRYEFNATTTGVVFGIELVNEPSWFFWEKSLGLRELYEEMVPQVRRLLPANRYAIFLNFMESPRTTGAMWMETMRQRDPENYKSVIYDAHVYHAFGDDNHPQHTWDELTDACKTCCRDPALLAPLSMRGIPMTIGEFSLNTGFPGNPSFWLEYLINQLSLFANTPGMVGSFFWNHWVLRFHGGWYKEMSLLELIAPRGSVPPVSQMDLSVRCPGKDLAMCPAFNPNTALWSSACRWKGDPEVQERVCPGTVHMEGYGPVSLVPTGWEAASGTGPVRVLGGRRVAPHIRGRAYFADTCKAGVYNRSEYLSLQLLGRTLRYTADVSRAGCGCNAAVYLNTMHHNARPSQCGDHYCDANKVCGESCVEIDLQEANGYAWRSTLHTARDHSGLGMGFGGGGRGWSGARDWAPGEYGPAGRCIDTRSPFQVAASFPVDRAQELVALEVRLSQRGQPCDLSLNISGYWGKQQLSKALRKGMTPVVSYWASKNLYWLDGQGADGLGPCAKEAASDCAKSVQFWGFSLETIGQKPLAKVHLRTRDEEKPDRSGQTPHAHRATEPDGRPGEMVGSDALVQGDRDRQTPDAHRATEPDGRSGELVESDALVQGEHVTPDPGRGWPTAAKVAVASFFAAALGLSAMLVMRLQKERSQHEATDSPAAGGPLEHGRPSSHSLLSFATDDPRQGQEAEAQEAPEAGGDRTPRPRRLRRAARKILAGLARKRTNQVPADGDADPAPLRAE